MARVLNTGQVCCAGKRFIVDERIYDQYMEALMQELKTKYVVGDPMDPKVNLGPLARPDLLAQLKSQVEDAKYYVRL